MQLIRGEPDWWLSSRQHHEAFDGDKRLLPELPLLGRMHLLDALPKALIPHAHPGIYEAHFVVDGCLAFHVGRQDFEIAGGSVFLTKPGQLHGAVDCALQPAAWFWIHLQFPTDAALPGLSLEQTQSLENSFANTTLNQFPGSDELQNCFERLLEEHRSHLPHSITIARGQLHELMVRMIRDHDHAVAHSKEESKVAISMQIRKALDLIDQNIGEPLSIPELAEASGLSESHFRQCFHKETGFTPSDYLARRRVSCAKPLLRNKQLAITEIAYRLGFGSSPYFAAVFKKLTGMSPSEYRDETISTG